MPHVAPKAANIAAEGAPTAVTGSQADATDQAGASEAPVKRRKKGVEAAGDQAGTSDDGRPCMPPLSADEAHADLAGPSDPDAQNGKTSSWKKGTPAESGTMRWSLHGSRVLIQHLWAST